MRSCIVLFMLIVVGGCGNTTHTTVAHATIYTWKDFRRDNLHEFISSINNASETRESIAKRYGKPDLTEMRNSIITDTWIFGARRRSVENDKSKRSITTYLVSYAIIKARWKKKNLASCTIMIKSFIGKDGAPGVFDDNYVDKSEQTCRSF